jgi:hypothetical protein
MDWIASWFSYLALALLRRPTRESRSDLLSCPRSSLHNSRIIPSENLPIPLFCKEGLAGKR